jgi:hypothetical protein
MRKVIIWIDLKTKNYLSYANLYPSKDLAQFHGIFFFSALFQFSQFIVISNIFGLNITKET